MVKMFSMKCTCPAFQFVPIETSDVEENSCLVNMSKGTTPLETAFVVLHIFFTVLPIVFSVACANIIAHKINFSSDTWKFLLDLLIIVVPIILNVTVLNPFVGIECSVLILLSILIIHRIKSNSSKCKRNVIDFGHQPKTLTFIRSTINIITVVCILAIDFSSFPKPFRKSRTYGVGLMDTGIGLFVFSMGIVSKPLKCRRDFVRLAKMVGPTLFLGIARTVIIQSINYHQDDTEYGKHLNAFFTLGLTKLIGGTITAIVCSEFLTFILGIFIVAAHECALLTGLADFVMNDNLHRSTWFLANREGICSLPGFIGIYLISMYIGRFLYSESIVYVQEYTKKVKKLGMLAASSWIITFICIPTVKISRRVSNFGYVAWIFSIALTILLLYIIISDYIFNVWSESDQCHLPSLMDATNRNGLVFFLIGNILTGCVNMFLNPSQRNIPSSITILCLYMLLSTSVVYLLLRLKIKIA